MIEFLQNHWGDLFSLLGILVSAIGLGWAVLEARGARSAAQAAERATLDTRERIGRHLVVVDLERTVALLQRLKLLHDTGRWEAALEQYQTLRAMLSAIVVRYPERKPNRRQRLTAARNRISIMEERVQSRLTQKLPIEEPATLHQQLNRIQVDLEDMVNTIRLGDEQGGD